MDRGKRPKLSPLPVSDAASTASSGKRRRRKIDAAAAATCAEMETPSGPSDALAHGERRRFPSSDMATSAAAAVAAAPVSRGSTERASRAKKRARLEKEDTVVSRLAPRAAHDREARATRREDMETGTSVGISVGVGSSVGRDGGTDESVDDIASVDSAPPFRRRSSRRR